MSARKIRLFEKATYDAKTMTDDYQWGDFLKQLAMGVNGGWDHEYIRDMRDDLLRQLFKSFPELNLMRHDGP